jgi:4'-phosphopantetheinyl transferase
MPVSRWNPVDRPAALPRQAVHIWRVPLRLDQRQLPAYEALVTPEELLRARRFIMQQHQHRFLAGRARMRCLLAGYLDVEPRQISLCYENLGKPFLDPAIHRPPLHFNFSNSHDWGLLAVSYCRTSIGVDLEQTRSNRDLDGLATRYFHPSETSAIQQDTPPEQVDSFYRCWTRKEAFLKATGKGLTFPLRDVIVSCRANEAAVIRSIAGDASRADQWCLVQLEPASGFVGALVHEAPGLPVVLCDWTEDHRGL